MQPIPVGDSDAVQLPRWALRFPLELNPPLGFDPNDIATWPKADGRLEFLEGRLLYMPPCGDDQSDVAVDVARVLGNWRVSHPDFVVGGNEVGIRLGDDSRGADAAVWRRDSLPANTGGFRRVPPLLAVEIAGQEDSESQLREKARWYLDHAVRCVWLLIPETREVIMLSGEPERRLRWGDRMPPVEGLPGLEPLVSDLFAQLGPLT